MRTYTDVAVSFPDGDARRIALVEITREAASNAFRTQTYADLAAALREVDALDSVLATVVTGRGRFFSSGADFTEPGRQVPPDAEAARAHFRAKLELATVDVTKAILAHRKVVIVALNGAAIGFPAGVIGAADIVYAADSAWLSCPFAQLGLSPEGTSSFGFVLRMGLSAASEALLFGRRFTAQELERLGFVSKIFPAADFHKHCLAHVAGLLKSSGYNRASIEAAKRLIRGPIDPAFRRASDLETDKLVERFMSGDPDRAFKQLAKARL